MFIRSKEQLATFIKQIENAPVLAIDTEFHTEKTYYPRLCLIQMATEEHEAIIDPLAIKDLSILAPLLSCPSMVKIFHSGSQDIDILQRACGVVPSPIFDTQVAAGLLGYPQQMGYGPLVQAVCDVALPKGDSFTDWARRPLSETQLEYAIDDVRYLPRIYHHMVECLEESGRSAWLDEDFAHLEDPKTYASEPNEAWRKVRRASSLTRRQLVVLQAVAAWRERTAQSRNIPKRWVLSDEILLEIGRRTPTTRESLLEVRGSSEHLNESSINEILDATCCGLARDPETWPKLDKRPKATKDAVGVIDLMQALLHLRASQNGVATHFLASKDDLTHLMKGETEDLPLMQGWRWKIVGEDLLRLLTGELYLHIDEGQMTVVTAHQVAGEEGYETLPS